MMPWVLVLIVQGAVLCTDNPSCTVVSAPAIEHVQAFDERACDRMRDGVLADAKRHGWERLVSATCHKRAP